jgi:hypothetical protein
VGGLAIDVMGWTGPRGEGSTPYTVEANFPGMYVPEIVVLGSNKRVKIPVKQIPYTSDDAYIEATGAAPPLVLTDTGNGLITLETTFSPPPPYVQLMTVSNVNCFGYGFTQPLLNVFAISIVG